MAIYRIVETDIYCDVCGEWVIGWRSNGTGVSREWAKYYARTKGCTTGKKIICKNAESKSESKHATFSAGSEVQGETRTALAWD